MSEEMKCQYCGGPSPKGYTCDTCKDGWPIDDCRCENNGDYCDACYEWVEKRRANITPA
jgi:hypothetical protein